MSQWLIQQWTTKPDIVEWNLARVSITTIFVATSLLTYNDMNLLDQFKFTMHRQTTYIWPSLHFWIWSGKTAVRTWHPSQKFRFRRNYLLFSSITPAHSLTSLYSISNFRCDVSELRIKYIPHALIIWFPNSMGQWNKMYD